MTSDRLRQCQWDGCTNVRDLGGLPIRTGGVTPLGRVFRADLLGKLTPTGWQQLFNAGVRRIIDLRAAHEVAELPYPVLLTPEQQATLLVQNLPMESFLPHVSARIRQANSRAEVYIIMLDGYPDLIATILRAIAAEPAGVVFHCQAGKDRTGTIAALLLDLAQVEREAIVGDYAISQVLLPPTFAPGSAVGFWQQPTATAAMMEQTLAWLDTQHGGVRGYMRSIGLSDAEIEVLNKRLSPFTHGSDHTQNRSS